MALTKVSRNLLSTGIDDQSTSTAITIDTSGNVGIGTTSGVQKLTVAVDDSYTDIASGSAPLELTNTNGTNGTYSRIYFNDVAGGAGSGILGVKLTDTTNNYGQFEFWTRGSSGNATRMVIDPNGNVGIGTSSPTDKLHVVGTSFLNGNTYVGSGGSGNIYLSAGTGIYMDGGTTSANHLDDYEEGSWSPSIGSGTANFGNSTYTKVGNLVKCTTQVNIFSDTSTSAAVVIGNLPFTAIGTDRVTTFGVIAQYISSSFGVITAGYFNSTSSIILYNVSSGAFTQLTHADFSSSTSIYLSFTYHAA